TARTCTARFRRSCRGSATSSWPDPTPEFASRAAPEFHRRVTSLPDGELETATEMALALRRRRVTPRELLERSLARAEAWQPATNAFSQLWAEEAEEDAQLVEVAARVLARSGHLAGGGRAPVAVEGMPVAAGIPIAVKDLFDVSGHETTGCCAAYRGAVALHDARMVEGLRDSGMVIIG